MIPPSSIDHVRVLGKRTALSGAAIGFGMGLAVGALACTMDQNPFHLRQKERPLQLLIYGVSTAIAGAIAGQVDQVGEIFKWHGDPVRYRDSQQRLGDRANLGTLPPPELQPRVVN